MMVRERLASRMTATSVPRGLALTTVCVLILSSQAAATSLKLTAIFTEVPVVVELVQGSEVNRTILGRGSGEALLTAASLWVAMVPCSQLGSQNYGDWKNLDIQQLFNDTNYEISDVSLYDTKSLVLKNDDGEMFDCADLVEADNTFKISTGIIIVLLIAGLIFVFIVICIPIIYCCMRNRRGGSKEDKFEVGDGDGDSVDDPFLANGRRTKSELSIPYMDASLPPTPKGGRSGFRLQDLLGNNNKGSSSSISDKPL